MSQIAPCDRFEREGLLQLERGGPLDAHFEECPDCLRSRRAYKDLQTRLRGPASEDDAGEMQPPGDWQARVFAGIARRRDARRDARRRRRLSWFLAPALALVLLAVGLRVLLPGTRTEALELATTIVRSDAVMRGEEARPGDRLRLQVSSGGGESLELRLYLGERTLLARCGSGRRAAEAAIAVCEASGDLLELEVEMTGRGRYQGMVLRSEDEIPAELTGKGLDADAGSALRAGAEVRLGTRVVVR